MRNLVAGQWVYGAQRPHEEVIIPMSSFPDDSWKKWEREYDSKASVWKKYASLVFMCVWTASVVVCIFLLRNSMKSSSV